MKVTFNKDHVYLNLDSENIGANIACKKINSDEVWNSSRIYLDEL